MNRLRLIIFREWYTRVRRRAFILGTLLVPILMAILVGFGVWMEAGTNGGEQSFGGRFIWTHQLLG